MKYFFLILLTSCALFKSDPTVPEKIKEQNLAGHWKGVHGEMSISCNGDFEYHEDQSWDNMVPKHSETGGKIHSFTGYSFKTGPFMGETHDINRMPQKNDKNEWWMDMDGKSWHRTKVFDC